MKRTYLCLILALCFFATISAQETANQNTLEDQFTEVIDKSNNYQEFKVIKKIKINQLRKNIMDSVSALKSNIDTLSAVINTQKQEITSLNQTLTQVNNDLAVSKEKEDGIHLFGMLLPKTTYNIILWSIIAVLLFLLGLLTMKFKRGHGITREARAKLQETESEFDNHRQRSLEREQQLRRKLQDELNKQKNM